MKDYGVHAWDQAEFDVEGVKAHVGLPKDGMYNYNAFYMYYHMYRVGQLVKRSGIHYSGILHLRADMIFEEDMYVAPLLLPDTLYTTDVRDCGMFETNLFYGTTDTILKFFSIYECLDAYKTEGKPIFNQTATFFHHTNTLPLNRVEFKLSYKLVAQSERWSACISPHGQRTDQTSSANWSRRGISDWSPQQQGSAGNL